MGLYIIPSSEKRKILMSINIIADNKEEALKKYNDMEEGKAVNGIEFEDIMEVATWDRCDEPSEICKVGK